MVEKQILLDPFSISLILIILTAITAAFIRRVSRDKCLRSFEGFTIALERTDSDHLVCGKLRVENTGMEFTHEQEIRDGFAMSSYLIYKYEYSNIMALIRYYDNLDESQKALRNRVIKNIYKPSLRYLIGRRFRNIFRTVRDSITEVFSLLVSYAQKSKKSAQWLGSQDKYVKKIQTDLVESVGVAHEPLLEAYRGKNIVFELIREDKIELFSGRLKDYSANFIEILDVKYKIDKESRGRMADIVVPQKMTIVRHLGTKVPEEKQAAAGENSQNSTL